MKKRRTLTFKLSMLFSRMLLLTLLFGFGAVYLVLTDLFENIKHDSLSEEMVEWERMYESPHRIDMLSAEFASEISGEGEERVLCRVLNPDQSVLLSTPAEKWTAMPAIPVDMPIRTATFREFHSNGHIFLSVFYKLPNGTVFNYVISFKEYKRFLKTYRKVAIWSLLLAILLAIPLIFRRVKREVNGVNEVASAAQLMSEEGQLNHAVTEDWDGVEVHNLAVSFNLMQQKISTLITDIKDVSNNIAHDMRSPLTRMRGIAETTLISNSQEIDHYQQMAGSIVEESDRLIAMIGTMLAITEIESADLQTEQVNLSVLVGDATDIFETAAEFYGLKFTKRMPTNEVRINGNKSQLQRCLANLLDNACKYTSSGGAIYCALTTTSSEAIVTVSDTGIGIAKAEQNAIFDRFYRCDRSRSNAGNGLGLSYVQTIVRKHGGTIHVKSTEGKGAAFTLTLPL